MIDNPDCDINVHSRDDDNILTLAYQEKDTECLNMLMNNSKIHINIKFHAACLFGDLRLVHTLLSDSSVDVNYRSTFKQTTALQNAI